MGEIRRIRAEDRRVATRGDNADLESFSTPLQNDFLNHKQRGTHEELPLAILTWLEVTYRCRRRQPADTGSCRTSIAFVARSGPTRRRRSR